MPILLVVAHPDDEVLGFGASVAMLAEQGTDIYTCILSGTVEARRNKPEQDVLVHNIEQANNFLGVKGLVLGSFPNIEFNVIPHLELVRFIEEAIEEFMPDVIITHHPSDLNNDHLQTSLACQAAARLFQRKDNIVPLKSLFYMEILSSTDWAFSDNQFGFKPDSFLEVGEGFIDKKIQALKIYEGITREYPHPRSEETIKGLAAYRGSQAGLRYAEALQTAFRQIRTGDF
ncbi:MAG: PIG-L family deacetylase [Syntrophomonadaceae bacterium]|nr:PIG-L family deacetylase [Syntrophomonadaceae bacterium]